MRIYGYDPHCMCENSKCHISFNKYGDCATPNQRSEGLSDDRQITWLGDAADMCRPCADYYVTLGYEYFPETEVM